MNNPARKISDPENHPDIFTLMLEPVKACNIKCLYCYSDLAHQTIMSHEILAAAIQQALSHVKENRFKALHIIWHGGEPLLAGLDFFRTAASILDRYESAIPITQFIQTNGLLLDEDFCLFFGDRDIQLGISLDGPEELHNAMRKTRHGQGTHDKVMDKILLVENTGLPFGLCMVVTPLCQGREKEIYGFFKGLGKPFRANPMIPPFHPAYNEIGRLRPGEYGRFMCKLFDEWIQTETNRIQVSPLDSYLLSLTRGKSPECQQQLSCVGTHISVRPDGSLVLCSRFQDHRLGRIQKNSFKQIHDAGPGSSLAQRANNLTCCRACISREICHGGCPHNAAVFSGDPMKQDPLCQDYQMIYTHLRRELNRVAHDIL